MDEPQQRGADRCRQPGVLAAAGQQRGEKMQEMEVQKAAGRDSVKKTALKIALSSMPTMLKLLASLPRCLQWVHTAALQRGWLCAVVGLKLSV